MFHDWLVVEPRCESGLLAPEILQESAVGASNSGMFPKAPAPGPSEESEACLMARHKAFNVSPVPGCAFSPSGKSGRPPAGPSVGSAHHSYMFTVLWCSLPMGASYAVLGCQDRPHMHAVALVCFLNLGVLGRGGENTFSVSFSEKNETIQLILSQR